MLKIITSLCGKKRLEYLTAKLTASDSAVLVVPEQFLFESERGMYRLLGARKIAITEITGLSKLAADLLKKHGEPKLYADDIVKIVTMYKTLRRLSRSRRGEDAAPYVYTSVTFDSAKRFLDIIADLKSADISPALLKDSLLPNEENPDNNKQESGLADKLRSISEIYEAYSAFLNADEFADKLDDISRAADLIDSLDLLRGKEVFLYEFDGFSASQIKLIRAVSESADSVTILLRTDAEMSEVPEFRAVNTLISRLKRDIPFEVEVLGGESYSPRVELWQSDNVRGESEFVAAEIRKLITENGYICNDIAVLTCGGSPADSTRLKQSLNEYDIACYTDLPEPIIAKSMTRFVLTALEAVGLDTPKLLSYIRSGYVRVRYDLENDDTVRNLRLASPDEVRLKGSDKKYAFDKGGSRLTRRLSKRSMDLLERTAFRYALTRREWGKSFPKTSADLRRVEPLRNDIVRPLLDLKASCENKDGSEITEILCRFLLDTMQLQKTVLGLCEQTQSDFENKSLAEEFRQLWDLIIDVFESLYAALKGEQLTLGEYTELLRGVFSSVNIAKPPQVLDAVVIGDLSRSRMSDIKIVFVTGAVSGKFPKSCAVAGGGIFTGRELESLSERGLELSSNLQQRYDFERLVVNKTLTLPSEKLYLCAALSNSAWEELIPSVIFSEFADSRGCTIRRTADLPLTERVRTVKSAKRILAEENVGLPQEVLDKVLDRILSPNERSVRQSEHILDSSTANALFTQSRFSPTAIETMMSCRFRYFCKYGLNIDLPVAENEDEPVALERGNIIHYCLDRILRESPRLQDGDLDAFIESCIKEYRDLRLPSGYAQTARQSYILMSFKTGISRMVKHFVGDFDNSLFKPAEFEKKMDFMFGNVRLTGKIDRIDRFGDYVRITDYKSGQKEMDFPSVFYGLDMQMLLYLFAVCDSGGKPASALYLPSDGSKTDGVLLPKDSDSAAVTRKSWLSAHTPSGIVVKNNDDVFGDFVKQESRYRAETNATERKRFFKVEELSEAAYERLKDYCGRLVGTQVSRVKRGNVEAVPLSYSAASCKTCDYCEYSSACNRLRVKVMNKEMIGKIL